MMAAEKEELLAYPLMFRAIVALVVSRSPAKTAPSPRAAGAPPCVPTPRASVAVGGGGTKQNKKLRRLDRIMKIRKSWKSHKNATGIQIHAEDAPNVFEINWAKCYPNCEPYKKFCQDALNGNFPDGLRLADNKLVRNERRGVHMPLVHRLVAKNHDVLHLAISSVEK